MTYKITVDDLLQDLELAKQIAIKGSNANSLVNAVMAQARLIGALNGDTLKTSDPTPITVTIQTVDARKHDRA